MISPETWDRIAGNLGHVLDNPRTVCVACVIIYAINYSLGVVGLEMAMDFGSTMWNRCLVRGLPTDSPLHGCGTIKNSSGLLVRPKMVHVCCKQNLA